MSAILILIIVLGIGCAVVTSYLVWQRQETIRAREQFFHFKKAVATTTACQMPTPGPRPLKTTNDWKIVDCPRCLETQRKVG